MDKQVGNIQLMQKMNRLKVLNFVRHNPDVSRPVIAEQTGLSLPSLTNITAYLLENGLLYESGTEQVGRVGRKGTLLRFGANSRDLICIYLTGKHLLLTFTNLEGVVSETIRVDTDCLSMEEIVEQLRKNVKKLVKTHDKSRILGIAMAISGLVLEDSRFVLSAHLQWNEIDLKHILENAVALPVFIDNVSVLKAVWYFSQMDANSGDNVLYIDMNRGIGAVQYVGGEISRWTLGEVGHTTVKHDGPQCFCGNRGCLEAMCSGKRLMELYREHSGLSLSSLSQLDRLYKKGDPAAQYAISDCGMYLGIGLANLVNLFNPSALVLNTGDFDDCPSLILEAEKELRKRAYPVLTQGLIIKLINESEEHILSGAAIHFCDRIFTVHFPGNIL